LQFRILGPLEVWDDAEPLQLGGPRTRGLLGLLLLRANELVSNERLVDELFPHIAPARAANNIQQAISRLRRVLGEGVIETRESGYRLAIDAEQLDVGVFERLLAQGRESLTSGDALGAATTLREALGLWRGPALADLGFEEYAQPEIRRLEGLRLAALQERIEADLALGRSSELVPELEALVAANPVEERLRGQLMLALYRSGRQAEALAVYRDTRKLLAEQLGLEPSRALRELERSMLRHDAGLERSVEPTPSIVCPFKGPAPFSRDDAAYFFGRERMVADLIARLAAGTFVGVVGPSGCGKSSLL
jgi:DNA-binding SARP family transcriptional activator